MPQKPKADPHAEREAKNYANPVVSREWLLEALDLKPQSYEELCELAHAESEDQREGLRRRLKAMIRDGQVLLNRRDRFVPISKADVLHGKIIGHRDGYGFFRPDDGSDDIFINQHQMAKAFDGDIAVVRPGAVDRRGRREGTIIHITQRANTKLVGRFVDEGYVRYVIPDNQKINQNIVIAPEDQLDARDGQMVVAELISYPSKRNLATAKIVQVLGDTMAAGMEIEVAIHSHQIPAEWPEGVTEVADQLPEEVIESDKLGRFDLRNVPLVTIDGEDARDFDDAVYAKRKPDGGFTLYVAIADVSHYVKPMSALDIEGINRGNSTYFPGYVVPMLPEQLSNGLCSLNPEVDRLAMVCEMQLSAEGEVNDFSFYEAVIHSHRRLTYSEVGRALSEGPDGETRIRLADRIADLETLHALYNALRAKRDTRGAIDFETVEPRIIFGPGRKIEKIVPVERNDAHKMIEEAMLAANVCAAELLAKAGIPALYRVHEGPAQERLENLRAYLGELGLSLTGGDQPTPADYQLLLGSIGDRPDAHVIQSMMLRSMAQAQYRPDNEGHFGLAYSAYTHFTSPIRRYPDLLVHRAIRALIAKNDGTKVKKHPDAVPADFAELYPYDMNAMLQAGEQCSMTERRSDDATRDVIAWLKCEFLRHHLGEEFDGTVATVTSFGLFIELNDLFIEGLAHISNLTQDYYHFDQAKQRLVAEHSGNSFNLGDSVRVKVARVDLDERKIDLELVGHESRRSANKTRNKGRVHKSDDKAGKPARSGGKSKATNSKAGPRSKSEKTIEAKPRSAKASTSKATKTKAKPASKAVPMGAVKAKPKPKPKAKTDPKSQARAKSGTRSTEKPEAFNDSRGSESNGTRKPRRRTMTSGEESTSVSPRTVSKSHAEIKARAKPGKAKSKPKKPAKGEATTAQPVEKKKRWWPFGRS